MVHLEKALGDDTLHRLDISIIDQVENPGGNAAVVLWLSHPHQELVSLVELDQCVRHNWCSAVRVSLRWIDNMNHVLLLLLSSHNFVNAQEKTFFDEDVLVQGHVIFEKVADNLDQTLNDLHLNLIGQH